MGEPRARALETGGQGKGVLGDTGCRGFGETHSER